jgi:hypothetical protein
VRRVGPIVVAAFAASCGRFGFVPSDGTGDGGGDRDSSLIGTDDGNDSGGDAMGLVAWYQMDGSLVDASGHGHDATCTPAANCPISGAGMRATAMAFDGTNDLARVPSATDLRTTSGLTVAAWVYYSPPVNLYACPLSKVFGAASDNSWELCMDGVQTLFFHSYDGTTSNQLNTGSNAITRDAWYHLALRWNGATNTKEILVNGIVVRSGPGAMAFDNGDVLIGADVDAGTANVWFPGRLDDVRIYDRALDDAALATLAMP